MLHSFTLIQCIPAFPYSSENCALTHHQWAFTAKCKVGLKIILGSQTFRPLSLFLSAWNKMPIFFSIFKECEPNSWDGLAKNKVSIVLHSRLDNRCTWPSLAIGHWSVHFNLRLKLWWNKKKCSQLFCFEIVHCTVAAVKGKVLSGNNSFRSTQNYRVEGNRTGVFNAITLFNLFIWVIMTHTGVRPYKCWQCDFSSITKSHLKMHILVQKIYRWNK